MKRSPRLRFAYQLGSHLGIKEVERDIVDGMSARQFLRWEAYSQMEPFGEWRADVRTAQLAAMLFNLAVVAKERKPIKDFLLPWEKLLKDEEAPVRQQTWQEKLAIAHMWARALANTRPPREEEVG